MDAQKGRVLSMRLPEETFRLIDDFRNGQLAIPSQSEALRALVRLGFEKWEAERAQVRRDSK